MKFRHLAHGVGRHLRSAEPVPRQKARPLVLECLEERTLPAVVFNPVFGAEATRHGNGESLSSPHVYLIFWGKSWGGTNTQLQNTAGRVIASPFLSGLVQYGSDGQAILGDGTVTSVWDSSPDPVSGSFDSGNIAGVIRLETAGDGPLPRSASSVYVVVTMPGIQSNQGSQVGGFNFIGNSLPSIWCSSGVGSLFADTFSQSFSHELAEIMSDPGGNGYEVNPGSGWNGTGSGNQIGDYEGNSYAFRESNGVLVQPYWSNIDQVWVAPDDDPQDLFLTPMGWDDNFQFHQQYGLTIKLVNFSPTDILAVDSSSKGLSVTFNGARTVFDPVNDAINEIYVNGVAANNATINVESTGDRPIIVDLGVGQNTVNITPSSENLDQLGTSHVQLASGGNDILNINDQSDSFGGTYSLQAGPVFDTISRSTAAGEVDYLGFKTINLFSGSIGEMFAVGNTEHFADTNIICGPGGSAIGVQGTTGKLKVVTATPRDSVEVFCSSRIQGAVIVENGSLANTTIYVNDSSAKTQQHGTLDTRGLAGEADAIGVITGMTPAPIQFQWKGTAAIHITTGRADDTLDIRKTQSPVYLDSKGGMDTVNVGGTGPEDKLGDAQGIKAPVWVSNSHGFTALAVDDLGDPQGQPGVVLTPALVMNLAPAEIHYSEKDLASLTVRGGRGGNRFTVRGTLAGTMGPGKLPRHVYLYAGALDDRVNVGNLSNDLDAGLTHILKVGKRRGGRQGKRLIR